MAVATYPRTASGAPMEPEKLSTGRKILWFLVAVLGALALGIIATARGEPINAMWLVLAAICVYMIGYRFYSRFISYRVLGLDDSRATPAERLDDGRDFVPTNKWVLFGHHFASIAGPGPLVGPTLAAQFGYLPGTLWIVIGAVLGGCVQDFVVLFCSTRRNGKSLSRMAHDEISETAGVLGVLGVLSILTIILAVVALVVVNALRDSPWGVFTIGMTMPIAVLMGLYLRFVRPGRAFEAALIGFALILGDVVLGGYVAESATLAPLFTYGAPALGWMIVIYAFAASVLPVWILLAPRDALSTFIKLGVMFAMAGGILLVRPVMLMPAWTTFAENGNGPIFAGSVFPFAFITIACGALSGFHSLISSGTTPKMVTKESQTRMIGYGSMLMESLVGVMAMIAACVLQPGVYFAVNGPAGVVGATPEAAVATITGWGFPVTAQQMSTLAAQVGEITLFNRTGGAPSFALGMAHIFSGPLGGEAVMSLWYHFAIMFEALFILTIVDTGTRVGRFMLQELLGRFWKPMGNVSWTPGVVIASALMVGAWAYFLFQGIADPLGGINSLWPLFGISNQLLAAIALCVCTTVIIKMNKTRYIMVTLGPLIWLVAATMTASYQKIWSPDPALGFLAHAQMLAGQLAAGTIPADQIAATQRVIFNDRLDAVVTLVFAAMVILILIESGRNWWMYISGRKTAVLREAPFELSRLTA